MTYTKYIQFGKGLNQAGKNPYNAANPLTYCMFPTLNSQFVHGSSSGGILYGNQNTNCMNYMAERCSQNWDGFCSAYMDMNVDTYWPNTGCIDAQAYENAKQFLSIKTTIGQDLLRNSCYRKFIWVPDLAATKEPFDYTVANSPIITIWDNYVPGYSQLQNLNDPQKIQQDPLIHKMIAFPTITLDVLGRIFMGYLHKDKNVYIKDTCLEEFFKCNHSLLTTYIQQAKQFVPSFNQQNKIYLSQCFNCLNQS